MEKNNPEEMEMPCLCDCRRWFDLNDGYRSLDPYHANRVVCPSCHNDEQKRQDEIDELESQIDWKEDQGKGTKRLQAKLDKIKW
jgi:hypothetical protein